MSEDDELDLVRYRQQSRYFMMWGVACQCYQLQRQFAHQHQTSLLLLITMSEKTFNFRGYVDAAGINRNDSRADELAVA